MTKSIKNGKAVYNFLDIANDNVEILFYRNDKLLKINLPYEMDCECGCVTDMVINQETAKDLIKVLQEFAETGELK